MEYYVVILFVDCGGLSGRCVCRVRRLLPVGMRAWAGMRVPSCSLLIWARMRCVCASCASSVACQHACVGGRMCAVVLGAHLGPYAVCVCVVCVVCCLSACVRGRAYVCRRARCSSGPVCGVCASCASSVACRHACVCGRMCAVVLGAHLGPYAVCVRRVRRLLPVGMRAWAGMRVPSCSLLIWARMRCVCVVCVVCCLSACVRGRAYVCRRARCSSGPVCGVCASCASSVACRRACVGGRMCAVVLAAHLGPYAVCVRRVRRLLPVGMRAWAGICVPSCSLLSCWRRDQRRRCVAVSPSCIRGCSKLHNEG